MAKKQDPAKPDVATVTPTPNDVSLGILKGVGFSDEQAQNLIAAGFTADVIEFLQPSDLADAGVAKLQAPVLLAKLKAAAGITAEPTQQIAIAQPAAGLFGRVQQAGSSLPDPMDAKTLLEDLEAGGTLKMGNTLVLNAVSAVVAEKVGYFQIGKKLEEAMRTHYEGAGELFDENYFLLLSQVKLRRQYPFLKAMPGASDYVTDASKKQFLQRFESNFWAAVEKFNQSLAAWIRAKQGDLADILAGALSGESADDLVPDPTPVVAASRSFIDQINTAFRGEGAICASALASDAVQIKSLLQTIKPEAIGAVNREEMLRKLNIVVSSEVVGAEKQLQYFVQCILELGKYPGDKKKYCRDLYKIGNTIPWQQFGVSGPSSNGTTRATGTGPFRDDSRL